MTKAKTDVPVLIVSIVTTTSPLERSATSIVTASSSIRSRITRSATSLAASPGAPIVGSSIEDVPSSMEVGVADEVVVVVVSTDPSEAGGTRCSSSVSASPSAVTMLRRTVSGSSANGMGSSTRSQPTGPSSTASPDGPTAAPPHPPAESDVPSSRCTLSSR